MKKYKLIIALKVNLALSTKEEQYENFRKQKFEYMKLFADKRFDIVPDINVDDDGILRSSLYIRGLYDVESIAEIFNEEVCFDYKNMTVMPLSTKKVLDESSF